MDDFRFESWQESQIAMPFWKNQPFIFAIALQLEFWIRIVVIAIHNFQVGR